MEQVIGRIEEKLFCKRLKDQQKQSWLLYSDDDGLKIISDQKRF